MQNFDVNYWKSGKRWRAELYFTQGVFRKGDVAGVGFGNTKEEALADGLPKARAAEQGVKTVLKETAWGAGAALVIGVGRSILKWKKK